MEDGLNNSPTLRSRRLASAVAPECNTRGSYETKAVMCVTSRACASCVTARKLVISGSARVLVIADESVAPPPETVIKAASRNQLELIT